MEGPPLEKTASTRVLSALTVYSPGCRAMPGDVDLDGMNLAKVHSELEVAVDAVHRLAKMVLAAATVKPATWTAPTLGR